MNILPKSKAIMSMQGGQLSQISAPNIQLKCAWRCTINVPLCLKGLSDIHTFLFSDCGQPCSGLLTQHFDIIHREFRPLLKDCYSQDTSQSSRLCFELKRSEAQNLCRLFNAASARVNLGAGATRPASQAAASSSKAAGTGASSSLGEARTSEVCHCSKY